MNQFNKILNYWQSNYSINLQESEKFNVPDHFKKIANLTAPGKSFYYIVNFHNLKLELVSDSVEEFIGEKASLANLDKLLSLALPGEIEKIHRKEKVINSFFMEYLKPEEILNYKLSYTYKNKSHDGKERIMLHQATVLSLNEAGRFVHVFSIHSDITHLTMKSSDDVSFININNGPSFYNVKTKSGEFDQKALKKSEGLKDMLTTRELNIIPLQNRTIS